MAYTVNLKKRAIKALEDINEQYYSNIKTAIYALTNNPRPQRLQKT
jgi:mRNA interferase RelE/StbE